MKKLCLAVFTFALLLFGSNVDTGYTMHVNQLKQDSMEEMFDSLHIAFSENNILEYSKRLWNSRNLISDYQGSLTVSNNSVNLGKVGTTILNFSVTGQDTYGQSVTKNYSTSVEVVDTAYPEIELKGDVVVIAINDKYNPNDNIESVTDPVDGDIAKADRLVPGSYVIETNLNVNKLGTYTAKVTAQDVNGNTTETSFRIQVSIGDYNHQWDGTRLTPRRGTIWGPSGKETYYNLPMQGVVSIMRRMGNTDPYWEREDGCKMLGDYIMVAANLDVHPRGSYVKTSLGMAIVCDTGTFAMYNPYQIDIAVTW